MSVSELDDHSPDAVSRDSECDKFETVLNSELESDYS